VLREGCVPFIDFAWAYVLNYAVEVNSSLWPAHTDPDAFKKKFEAQPYRPKPGSVDIGSWEDLARAVLPLCHIPSIKSFPLPANYSSTTLQGWSAVPLPEDPDCPYSRCTTDLPTRKLLRNEASAFVV